IALRASFRGCLLPELLLFRQLKKLTTDFPGPIGQSRCDAAVRDYEKAHMLQRLTHLTRDRLQRLAGEILSAHEIDDRNLAHDGLPRSGFCHAARLPETDDAFSNGVSARAAVTNPGLAQ